MGRKSNIRQVGTLQCLPRSGNSMLSKVNSVNCKHGYSLSQCDGETITRNVGKVQLYFKCVERSR